MYVPYDPDLEESFRWDRPGQSIVDAQLTRWINSTAVEARTAVGIEVDRCAGFRLAFDSAQAFEVFPNAYAMPHDIREQWRLFEPGRDSPHFVVENQGWGWSNVAAG